MSNNQQYTSWNTFLEASLSKYSPSYIGNGSNYDDIFGYGKNEIAYIKKPMVAGDDVSLHAFYLDLIEYNKNAKKLVHIKPEYLSYFKNSDSTHILGPVYVHSTCSMTTTPKLININGKLDEIKDFTVLNCEHVQILDYGDPKSMKCMHVASCPQLKSILKLSVDRFARNTLTKIGNLYVHDCPILEIISLHDVISVDDLTLCNLPLLKTIRNDYVGYIHTLRLIRLPSLIGDFKSREPDEFSFSTIGRSNLIECKYNDKLIGVDLKRLKHCKKIVISDNKNITHIDLHSLVTSSNIKICNNPELVEIDLSNLVRIDTLEIKNCKKLTNIYIRSLEHVFKCLYIESCHSYVFTLGNEHGPDTNRYRIYSVVPHIIYIKHLSLYGVSDYEGLSEWANKHTGSWVACRHDYNVDK